LKEEHQNVLHKHSPTCHLFESGRYTEALPFKIIIIMTKFTLKLTLLTLTGFTLLSFDLPADWFKAGSDPKSYDMGIEKGAGPDGENAATIKSIDKKIDGFGTLMQTCLADKYLGKRVRMSAMVKSVNVDEWAGLWFRVDQENSSESLAFDNMQDRAIKGTKDWKKYEIVLDVPEKAFELAYGALIIGTGQIWFTNVQFEIVDTSVKTTGMDINEAKKKRVREALKEPSNLSFDR
jgi:hypothetical protein